MARFLPLLLLAILLGFAARRWAFPAEPVAPTPASTAQEWEAARLVESALESSSSEEPQVRTAASSSEQESEDVDAPERVPDQLTLELKGAEVLPERRSLSVTLSLLGTEERVRAEPVGEGFVAHDLTPGAYLVTLKLESETPWPDWTGTLLETEVHVEGQTHRSLEVPPLYELTVNVHGGPEGDWVSIQGKGVSSSAEVELGEDRRATFEGLPAGIYEVDFGSYKWDVPVPGAEFAPVFQPQNALEILVGDSAETLALLGFFDGDVIVGEDDKRWQDMDDVGPTFERWREGAVTLLVLRSGRFQPLRVQTLTGEPLAQFMRATWVD